MAGLQRSAVSFRRQGSSGLVWDDKLVSAELNNDQNQDPKAAATAAADNLNARTTPPPTTTIQRTRSNGYRMGKVSPAIDPPSPKLSACGFCTAFSKTGEKGRPAKTSAKHRSR
ncbi:MAPK kinase substrate protein At1g80180 [Vigna radiata var. radiata]|uniref:MAPK kinase substrate protein At1g80180 n=1 Tax=Vigna radiata var. radiata TaxID=3916 RepID=A0A1S3VCQ3_VIGRR|nr:MAPK kinase substrate protein At1g80180 [Vigna radiata var. radiata]